jgi:tRNA-dependent cyclodipeptide synthase
MTSSFDYSVRVKTGAGWREHSRARLLISVGQDYHEGAKLKAVVAWINRNPSLVQVHVSVNDFLQRHNFIAAGLPASRAGVVALAAGDAWMTRNTPIQAELRTAELQMTRWRDWFDRPEFAASLTAITDYASADPAFGEMIERDGHGLAERRAKRGETVPDIARLVAHSSDYVREELAVFALQAAELPAAEVYPGSNLASAAYLVGRNLPEPIRPLASRYFTRIDFARVNLAPAEAPRLKIA